MAVLALRVGQLIAEDEASLVTLVLDRVARIALRRRRMIRLPDDGKRGADQGSVELSVALPRPQAVVRQQRT